MKNGCKLTWMCLPKECRRWPIRGLALHRALLGWGFRPSHPVEPFMMTW
jgi:hypothetical protein